VITVTPFSSCDNGNVFVIPVTSFSSCDNGNVFVITVTSFSRLRPTIPPRGALIHCTVRVKVGSRIRLSFGLGLG
jgi:hypothetical protein